MKKMISLGFTFILFFITGCSLANTESTLLTSDEAYMPYKVVFELGGETPNEDLFTWSWVCDEDNPTLESTCSSYGPGLVVKNQGVHIELHTEENIETTTTTINMEATIYFGSSVENQVIYPIIYLVGVENEEKKESQLSGFAVQSGLSISTTNSYSISENETVVINYQVHVKKIDALLSVEIQEFDDLGELIQTEEITQDSVVESLNLNADTAYVILLETYQNAEDEISHVRTLFEKDSSAFFILKFLESDGFVHSQAIHLVFPE